ncbi:hypothetical protein EKH57_00015 (plasmid) [Halorubrum sp. BOL3-1]|uniref:hypothetical protein n=1 Tax=Halorubrum sp. BOL3-1 TaxID=2497325 RepID=UPI001004FB7D|nr:hypothetical protein [Halorubrum sp. BOL3-1]QAU11319.1 hypothetical protein EKH57_00015 [Halorubrum sp. BOL3-1]
MSTTPRDDRRTETTNAPDTHALAAELGVDATLLQRFADEHPNPTAPIVLGWAVTRGELRVHPERLRDDVAAWIDATAGRDTEPLGVTEEDLRETRLRAHALRGVLGEGDE